MRLASFRTGLRDTFGVVTDSDQLIDLASVFPDAANLRELITAKSLSEIEEGAASQGEALDPADTVLLPPVTDAGKILCVGVNYREHRDEVGRQPLDHPTIFSRYNDSHVGHGQRLRRPNETSEFDYEAELAVVIGTPAWRVSVEEAERHVFGYSLYNDCSARDWQRRASQWLPGKNFFASGSFGPWIVPSGQLPDLGDRELTLSVDGEVRQHAPISDMLFDIPALISYISTFTPLRTGDVVLTGTPGGVGMALNPQNWLSEGQQVEVRLDGIGVLSNVVGGPDVEQPAL